MKALVITLLFTLFASFYTQAQFSEETLEEPKKGLFIGGSINFNTSENKRTTIFIDGIGIVSGSNQNAKNTSYSLNPTIGYQMDKHWIIGLDLLLTNSSSETDDTFNGLLIQEATSNSIGAFMRYIFNPQSKLQAYTSPYFRRSFQKSTFSFNNNSIDEFFAEETSNNFGLSLGAQYEISPWLRLRTNVGGLIYSFGKRNNDSLNFEAGEADFNSLGFNFNGSSIFFGAEFLF